MNKKTFLLSTVFVAMVMLGCGPGPKEAAPATSSKEVAVESASTKQEVPVPLQPKTTEDNTIHGDKPAPAVTEDGATIPELMQGKWQSTDDKTNYLVFEGNHRREIAAGMQDWDDRIVTISNRCGNEGDRDKEYAYESGKGTFITSMEENLCWSVEHVDKKALTLIYMGRGNMLHYKRVNE